MGRIITRASYSVAGAAGVYVWDRNYNHSNVTRAVRTVYTGATIMLDYKLRFNAYNDISSLHRRVAQRILHVCQRNGGLYVKFGQSIASLNQILPKEYNEILNVLQDRAGTISDKELDEVFRLSFDGRLPESVFSDFERIPVASASIAQVHKAKLADGTEVAVKVQKPAIRHQFAFDLALHYAVLWIFEKAFDLPLLWTHNTIHDHLAMETDFLHEARNAKLCRALLDPRDTGREPVYVPRIFDDFTTPMIMTAEWIDGVKINDTNRWNVLWRRDRVMKTVVDAFAKQIFVGGFVHCDPHPGNLLLRSHRDNAYSSSPQVVLLDHGLYLTERNDFRLKYCSLWEAIFLLDIPQMTAIAQSWGINDLNLFAASQLQKPWSAEKPNHLDEAIFGQPQRAEEREMGQRHLALAMQKKLKERARKFLQQSGSIPPELVLVGRNMNLVRSLNKELGSPLNRVGLMAQWAVRGLHYPRNLVAGDQVTRASNADASVGLFGRIFGGGRTSGSVAGKNANFAHDGIVLRKEEFAALPLAARVSGAVGSLLSWRRIRFQWRLFLLYVAFKWTSWNAQLGRAGYEGGIEGILEQGEEKMRKRLYGEA